MRCLARSLRIWAQNSTNQDVAMLSSRNMKTAPIMISRILELNIRSSCEGERRISVMMRL